MNVSIRLATPDDGVDIAAIYHPVVAETAVSFEAEPPNAGEMARRIERKGPSHPWLVCTWNERVVGYAYAGVYRERPAYRWSAESSVYVDASVRGRGIGRGLYTALLRILEAQGFHAVYAAITLPNPASIRVHEAVGFRSVGVFRHAGYKLGEWHDVGWWQRMLQTEGPPGPIRELSALVSSPDWAAHLEAGLACVHGSLRAAPPHRDPP